MTETALEVSPDRRTCWKMDMTVQSLRLAVLAEKRLEAPVVAVEDRKDWAAGPQYVAGRIRIGRALD